MASIFSYWEKLENWASGSYVRGYQCVAAGSLLLFGTVIIAAQVLEYLKDARWVPFSANQMILGLGVSWGTLEAGWRGIYKIMDQLPASLVFIGAGLIWCALLFRYTRRAGKDDK